MTAALALAYTAPPTTPLVVSFRRMSYHRQHHRKWTLPRMAAMHSMNDNFDNDDDEYHVDSSADDGDGDDDSIGGRGTNDDDDPPSSDGGNGGGRARKRDLLRTRITKKLNTDYLFRGMPGIESMLGGGGGGLSSSSSSTTASSTGDVPTGSDDGSRLQNQYMTGWWWQCEGR